MRRFGGVWAAIIALGFQALLLYYFSEKDFQIEYEFSRIFVYILMAFLFYGLSRLLETNMIFLNLPVKILILLLFPLTMSLLKIISPEEKDKIKEIYHTKIKVRFVKRSLPM